MKKIYFLFLITLLASCSYKVIPLKGTYSNGIYETTSHSDFETVWTNMIGYFAKNGIGIKTIDKSSGLIVAQSLSAKVTTEKKDGTLNSNTAWLVSARLYDPGPQRFFYPKTATIEWNIFLRKTTGNETIINVNLTSVLFDPEQVGLTGNVYMPARKSKLTTDFRSTGVFERSIADIIK